MVDLAPSGRGGAAGNDAAAVAQGDRAALMPIEDPLLGADRNDASVRAGDDALDDPAAGDVPGDRAAHRLGAAVCVRVPGAGGEVALGDRDDEGGRVPADGGQLTAGCRDAE